MDGGGGGESKVTFHTRYCWGREWGGESEKIKLLYVLAEHRVQNTEIQKTKNHVHKITNVRNNYISEELSTAM
jgi:hypothetical protein